MLHRSCEIGCQAKLASPSPSDTSIISPRHTVFFLHRTVTTNINEASVRFNTCQAAQVTAAQRSRQIHLTTRLTSCRPGLPEPGIFDVIVGTCLNPQRFGVDHNILTKRSDFFRTARSERWTSASNMKPTELPEQDPSIFDLYLDCLCDDAMPEVPLLALPSVTPGVTNINVVREKRPSVSATNKTLINAHWKKLIRLYTLADHLLDPKTANMTIDEMRRFYHKTYDFRLDTDLIDLSSSRRGMKIVFATCSRVSICSKVAIPITT
jgi:hypothetical protein